MLTGLRVAQFLTPQAEVPVLRAGDRLPKIIELLSTTNFHALPVTDEAGCLLGIVSLEEVHRASQLPNLASLVLAADLMRGEVVPLHPEDRLDRALELFVESDLLALPVVEGSQNGGKVIGVVKRADVSTTYLRYVQGVTAPHDGTA